MAFRWLKSLTPRSLFGRTAMILLVPILTIQIVVSYVFIQRLYQRVTQQMTEATLPSLKLVAGEIAQATDRAEIEGPVFSHAQALGFNVTFEGASSLRTSRRFYDLSGAEVIGVLEAAMPEITAIDLASNERRVRLRLPSQAGPVLVGFPRDRVSASNPHQLLVLMVFVAAVVTLISFLFLRNQVRPIRRLAAAASAFGRGQHLAYKPSGATEVRQAGAAFLEMRSRIERHIEQRTLLLSGVSHDLRTPLTRMKLQLSMMEEGEDRAALEAETAEMQQMLDTFLDFARLESGEHDEEIDPARLAGKLVARARTEGAAIELGAIEGEGRVKVRPMAVERAIQNLINNGRRYGDRVRLGVTVGEKSVRFTVEDDGPGIPEHRREEAMKPFARLDAARNQDLGGGVGLGLSIVQDIARQHGGTLRLGESADLGGLRADLVLAR